MSESKWDGVRVIAWEELKKNVEESMKRGQREYGDRSFEGQVQDTIKEIKEELSDVCGWSVIAYAKLIALEKRLQGNSIWGK